MRRLAKSIGIIVGVLVAFTTACGSGGSGSVKLAWQSQHGAELQLAPADMKNASVYDTTVYMSNETKTTLRDTRVRLRSEASVNAPIGFHIGTVAPVSSQFEGNDQVWSVGDLAPGAHVSMPLGLWFDLDNSVSQDHPVELSLDLVSPDLSTDVASNTLRIHLNP